MNIVNELGTAIMIWSILGFAIGAAAGYAAATTTTRRRAAAELLIAESDARTIREVASKEAEAHKAQLLLEAKENAEQQWSEQSQELRERRNEIVEQERRLTKREEQIEVRATGLQEREENLGKMRKRVRRRETDVEAAWQEAEANRIKQVELLEQVAAMTCQQAKDELLAKMEGEVRQDAALLTKRVIEAAQENAEIEARRIMTTAIQRYAADHIAESTVTVVDLPNDDMKGRIIGRQGRNIRALELATGVNLIIDDTPESVTVSAFNPVRREIAARALQKLIQDGRIHPTTIEEVVAKSTKEVEAAIRKAGDEACLESGIQSVHPKIKEALGRLCFRTSYGQNVLKHSLEVASLCEHMAGELGLDCVIAKRAGLFHDLGKAAESDQQANHAAASAEILRRCGEDENVIAAVEAHHDRSPGTIYGVLVQAADALSAARPGARREALETYVKRLEQLEKIASQHAAVVNAHAIQAGRELRVIVEPSKCSDAEMVALSRDLAKDIEKQLQYPGEIKVTVIRETRAVEYAR
ncbi:MAG: ribonuclease Y [Candidatus Schekmanbacteria bacterium]|nr:ribonuclease Y [Candidatus Schekmanbacteria bacterium]